MLSSLLALSLATSTALAAPSKHQVNVFDDAIVLEVKWRDRKKRNQDATVLLPREEVEEARRIPTRAPLRQAALAAANDVEARFDGSNGVEVQAKVRRNKELVYTAKGPDMASIRKALHDAELYGEERLDAQLRARGYRTYADNIVGPDYEGSVLAAAPHLEDLAKSLGNPRGDRRKYANQVLMFVQSIPYEETRRGDDAWRPPLAVLADNKGDCDSKVTLYLAIMRAAYPKMDMAFVHVPGHALAAIDLKPKEGDATIGKGKKQLVLLEPVGPSKTRVGAIDKKSERGIAKQKKTTVRRISDARQVRLVEAELAPSEVLHLTMW